MVGNYDVSEVYVNSLRRPVKHFSLRIKNKLVSQEANMLKILLTKLKEGNHVNSIKIAIYVL